MEIVIKISLCGKLGNEIMILLNKQYKGGQLVRQASEVTFNQQPWKLRRCPWKRRFIPIDDENRYNEQWNFLCAVSDSKS